MPFEDHYTAINYLKKIQEDVLWEQHREMLQNHDVQAAFRQATMSYHTDWQLLHIDPDDEYTIWTLVCEFLKKKIESYSEERRNTRNETYAQWTQILIERATRALEWCQGILSNFGRERRLAVGMASVDRLARDSALRSIASTEPGLIDMILQYI
jgi:hypothetical protein